LGDFVREGKPEEELFVGVVGIFYQGDYHPLQEFVVGEEDATLGLG